MCLMPFQQFSSYIMAVNFNSGETRVPVKNHQPTCCQSLTNFSAASSLLTILDLFTVSFGSSCPTITFFQFYTYLLLISVVLALLSPSYSSRLLQDEHIMFSTVWQTLAQQVVSITPRTHKSSEWLYTLIVCINVNLTIMGIKVFSIPIRYLIGYTVENIICSSCSFIVSFSSSCSTIPSYSSRLIYC
jgi:hypothetical protein